MSKQKRKPNLTPEQEKLLQKFHNNTGDNSAPDNEKGSAPKSKWSTSQDSGPRLTGCAKPCSIGWAKT